MLGRLEFCPRSASALLAPAACTFGSRCVLASFLELLAGGYRGDIIDSMLTSLFVALKLEQYRCDSWHWERGMWLHVMVSLASAQHCEGDDNISAIKKSYSGCTSLMQTLYVCLDTTVSRRSSRAKTPQRHAESRKRILPPCRHLRPSSSRPSHRTAGTPPSAFPTHHSSFPP